MLRVRQRLATLGTGVALAMALGGPAVAEGPAAPTRGRPAQPRAYLIYLIDGGDPIVVQKYTEQDGQIRFEKFGGWVSIASYEIRRIVPDESDDADDALPPPAPPEQPAPTLYVATRSGANVRATNVTPAPSGSDVRVSTDEGSLTVPRADVLGVLRVPAAPAAPEAWITLSGAGDEAPVGGPPAAAPSEPALTPPPALSDRPHLLQLTNGVVMQVDGFWLESGEIRFRRLGGVVGFALGEIARLLPQEVAPVRGRLPARFVRRLATDRVEVRLREGLRGVRLIGIEPIEGASAGPESPALEDPWNALDSGQLVHLEFDRERSSPDGDWLAYVYLPSGRMLNAELIRVGLARPRIDARNLRYVDLFEDLWNGRAKAAAPAPRLPTP
jgi:endonuclease YncB( thermonuclease family)